MNIKIVAYVVALLVTISAAAAAALGEYIIVGLCMALISMLYFYVSIHTEATQIYELYETNVQLLHIIWAKESIATKYVDEIYQFIKSKSIGEIEQYCSLFTINDSEWLKRADDLNWLYIEYHVYDLDGLFVPIFVRADKSYIISHQDNVEVLASILVSDKEIDKNAIQGLYYRCHIEDVID